MKFLSRDSERGATKSSAFPFREIQKGAFQKKVSRWDEMGGLRGRMLNLKPVLPTWADGFGLRSSDRSSVGLENAPRRSHGGGGVVDMVVRRQTILRITEALVIPLRIVFLD